MPEPINLPRLYDEKEVTRLLKRATELQREESRWPAPTGGLSLSELESIAGEAGIDPRWLRRAAAELDPAGGQGTLGARLAGEETSLSREIVIPGELPESGFERLVSVIQLVSRELGTPSLLGRSLTWQGEAPNRTRSLQVVVSVRRGETFIRVEERLGQLAGAVFAVSMGAVGSTVGFAVGLPVALEVLSSAVLAVGLPLGAVALSWVGAREIFRRLVRRRRSLLAELIDQLAREAEACIAEAGEAEAELDGDAFDSGSRRG
ncbi:MAG TPA: hypothetical protein VLH75_13460 [Longimicrobiales bacterium]|nr:hypothetical protein [Longimicrobiales bacterium]